MDGPIKRKVAKTELRGEFNLRWLPRIQSSLLVPELHRSATLSHERCDAMGFPKNSRSEIVRYYDRDRLVAEVHRYVGPQGNVLGSGLPDPKRALVEDELWWSD